MCKGPGAIKRSWVTFVGCLFNSINYRLKMGVNEGSTVRAIAMAGHSATAHYARVLMRGPERALAAKLGGQGGDLFTLIRTLTLSEQYDWPACDAANGRVTL
jgi:hypothetical protein